MFKSISGSPVYRYRDSQMQLAKSMQSMQEKKNKKQLGHHPYNTDEHLPLWEGKFQTESYFSGKRSLLLINFSREVEKLRVLMQLLQ